jgi:tRNA(Ile)-lysidine synthase
MPTTAGGFFIKLRGMSLVETFRRHIVTLALPPGRALVAVSGGPDSVALLDLLHRSRDLHGLDLVVAHADHGIHPESSRVAEQVSRLAATYGLPIEIGRLALGRETGETAARACRYAWLEEVRARLGARIILTAHHADDQVETVLMRVLAGSGPAGLAGMASMNGPLVRPLLSIPRAELVRHLEESGLHWWLDPANSDQRHLRSWIRTELLPAVRRRLPAVDANLERVARQAARDRAAWDSVLDELPGLDLTSETDGISVAASSLGGYDSPLAQAVILAAARRAGCQLGPARIGRVLELLKGVSSGARVPLGGVWTAELAFGRLRIWREEGGTGRASWLLEGQHGEGVWGRWVFRWQPAIAPDQQSRAGMSAWFSFDSLTVRAWAPGEKLKPLGAPGRRLIVRCFQDVRVPRSRRAAWPVLARNQEIVWIPGVCRSDALLPLKGTEALRVDAEYA